MSSPNHSSKALLFEPPSAPPLFGRMGKGRGPRSAPLLPMSREEMDALGWEVCDVILVTGDAYVDHPSFGMALIGRLLEAQGFRVGIISQPDWKSADDFKRLGRPRLYFGVTAGNMDSMVNRYTSDKRIRSDDAYTPGGEGGKRPDRSVAVYAQRCREAFKGVAVVLGGIEASLRRVAHFDYWSEKIRRSVIFDAKADILLYGNAERAIVELTHRLAAGEPIAEIDDLRGTVLIRKAVPEGWVQVDASSVDGEREVRPQGDFRSQVVRLPSYEGVREDPTLYAQASRVVHRESNPGNARALVQAHQGRELWLNPPPVPLETQEMDRVYELPYARTPHPAYGKAKIPAWEMIRFSITIQRGCFGGCTFCSITEHEGRVIQNRSEASIIREVANLKKMPDFTGVVSDLGGPTANMYRLACKSREIEAGCRKPSCVFPEVCPNLKTDHGALIQLYRKARGVSGVKRVNIASGVRYDLAVEDPRYIKELVKHHVGGYLKIAPEHVAEGPLNKMMKPGIGSYDRFAELFTQYSREVGKKQFLIPYFIAAHPGTTDEDMLELALWLKAKGFKADQVQTYLPSPMSTATAMYHSEKNPLAKITRESEAVPVPKGIKVRRLHKAFIRYHDPKNWGLLRAALKRMGREELIGAGPDCLIPWRDIPGRGGRGRGRPFATQHNGFKKAVDPAGGRGKRRGGRDPNRGGGKA